MSTTTAPRNDDNDNSNIANALAPGAAAAVLALLTKLIAANALDRVVGPGSMSDALALLLALGALGLGMLAYARRRLYFIDQDEQLLVHGLTATTVINGPRATLLPALIKRVEKRKALTLGERQYVVVKNQQTGIERVERGPQLLHLGAYDQAPGRAQEALSLKATEFVRFLNKTTGRVRVVRGEAGCVVPEASEVPLDGSGSCGAGRGKREAIDLRVFEYVRIEDKKLGTSRVERGEGLVFLDAHEEVVDGGKQRAVEIDSSTSVLVRNKRDGQQTLVTQRGLYIPDADEEILEIRPLIKLADYEAVVVRGKDGKDAFYFGRNDDERSFFLPPHSELVQLRWSRGRRRERRDLVITKIDLRPMYMSFEFNCRTKDNVELILEGSFFWEVVDLEAMIAFTNDTTGDVCNHARSRFIELVSNVNLQQFMKQFNEIAANVHQQDGSSFYKERGVKIHSLEVTGYRPQDSATAKVLSQIIQETTACMSKIKRQENQNKVRAVEVSGEIEAEKQRQALLEAEKDTAALRAAVAREEGAAEAQRIKAFFEHVSPEVATDDRLRVWETLRKREALREVAQGKAHCKLYFTPRDVDLSIQTHEAEAALGSEGTGSEGSFVTT